MLKKYLLHITRNPLKLLKTLKYCIIILAIIVFASGCYILDKSHNAAHNRAIKEDIGLFHKDVDSFLGTARPSSLREY